MKQFLLNNNLQELIPSFELLTQNINIDPKSIKLLNYNYSKFIKLNSLDKQYFILYNKNKESSTITLSNLFERLHISLKISNDNKLIYLRGYTKKENIYYTFFIKDNNIYYSLYNTDNIKDNNHKYLENFSLEKITSEALEYYELPLEENNPLILANSLLTNFNLFTQDLKPTDKPLIGTKRRN